MKKLCVFCGSSTGDDPKWVDVTKRLGRDLAENHWGLVYGGASIGLMGSLADACIESEGKVWGVIPRNILEKEIAHISLEELSIVDDMHQRKQKMYDLADGFLALPGGLGTLDELFEILTWNQLGIHKKPVFLMNWNGFYDGIIQHVETMFREGFLRKEHKEILQVLNTTEQLFSELNRIE